MAAKPTVAKEHLGPRSGVIPTGRRSTWVFSLAETTVPQMLLTTPEKSPEHRIRERRFFLSCGLTKVDWWTRKTGARDLGTLPGGSYSRAHDLNDSDEVAGVAASPAGDRAVLWTKSGDARDLGTLPGDLTSEAMAINNAGDVVGYSKGPSGMRAFLWTKGGGMQELGILAGGNSSRALAINDSGTVVGSSDSASGGHAFVWEKQTGIVDLNEASSGALGVVLVGAHAINRKGEILAMGQMDHGGMAPEDHRCAPAPPLSFLLTPTNMP